jgi:hypothetical protein
MKKNTRHAYAETRCLELEALRVSWKMAIEIISTTLIEMRSRGKRIWRRRKVCLRGVTAGRTPDTHHYPVLLTAIEMTTRHCLLGPID